MRAIYRNNNRMMIMLLKNKIQIGSFLNKYKKYSLFIFLFLLGILLVQPVYAQSFPYPGIDSVKFIPAHPISNNEIKTILYTRFNNGPATLDSTKISVNIDTVVLKAFYFTSGYSYFNNKIDTINLGFLSNGDYTLKAIFIDSNLVAGTVTDTFIIDFSVGTLSLENNKTSELKLFPNPTTNQLNFSITTNTPKLAVEIFDISGRKVSTTQYNSSNQGMYSKSIDVSALNKGLYLCRFIFNDHQVTRKFIKR